jgi:hypothetical protein
VAGKSKYFSKLWICDFRIFGFRVLTTYRLKTYRIGSIIKIRDTPLITKDELIQRSWQAFPFWDDLTLGIAYARI